MISTIAAVEAFLLRLAGDDADAAGFQWIVATVADRIISVLGGFEREGRFSGLVFSHDDFADVAPGSPGEWLVQGLIEDSFRRGLKEFDLGVGEARYKSSACEIVEPQFDTAFAVTLVGRAGAVAFRMARGLKRRIKQSPRLLGAARALQRLFVRPPVR